MLPFAKRQTQDRIKISELDITSLSRIVERFRAIKGMKAEIPVNIEDTLFCVLSTYTIEEIKEFAKEQYGFQWPKGGKSNGVKVLVSHIINLMGITGQHNTIKSELNNRSLC